jgi:hypothetical protein
MWQLTTCDIEGTPIREVMGQQRAEEPTMGRNPQVQQLMSDYEILKIQVLLAQFSS